MHSWPDWTVLGPNSTHLGCSGLRRVRVLLGFADGGHAVILPTVDFVGSNSRLAPADEATSFEDLVACKNNTPQLIVYRYMHLFMKQSSAREAPLDKLLRLLTVLRKAPAMIATTPVDQQRC